MESEGRTSTKKDHDRHIRRAKTAIALFCMGLIMACSSPARAVDTTPAAKTEYVPRATATYTPIEQEIDVYDQVSGPAGRLVYRRGSDGVPHIKIDGTSYDYESDCLNPSRPMDLRTELCTQVNQMVTDLNLDESARSIFYPRIVLTTYEELQMLCSTNPTLSVGGCYMDGGLIVMPLPPEKEVLYHEAGHAFDDGLTIENIGDVCLVNGDRLKLYIDFSRTDPPRPNQFPDQMHVVFIDELFTTMAEISAKDMFYKPRYAKYDPLDPKFSRMYSRFQELTRIFKDDGGFEKLRQNQFEAAVATLGDANDPTGISNFLELVYVYTDMITMPSDSGFIPHKVANPGPIPPQCK